MKVFNITTQRFIMSNKVIKAIVRISEDIIEFGYCAPTDPNLVQCMFKTDRNDPGDFERQYLLLNDENRKYLSFSVRRGMYFITRQFDELFVLKEENIKGTGNFPYSFKRFYEAFESFNIFKDRQKVINPVQYNLSNYLKYTFGVEFETSEGYVPEDICFRDGIVPLRDGSITGLEYSTVVLNGNTGINLLNQQIESLKKYTFFNKECALHIHMGGYPIDPKAIFILYTVCCMLESELSGFVPKWTFNTSAYKESGKDYCKLLNRYSTFENLYQGIAEQPFYGDLHQPHPHDIERNHKWDCHTRYYWVNILNMLCYDKCKTVEFRFLRPSFNFYKIYLWLYILNGILLFGEKLTSEIKETDWTQIIRKIKTMRPNFKTIMYSVYPVDIAANVMIGIEKLEIATNNQLTNRDYIGKDTFFDDLLFTDVF